MMLVFLCNFYTLFTIEINDSLSTHQNYYICSILKNLLDNNKKEKKVINSLIIFIYQNDDLEVIHY